jgi:rhamnosyltransferase
MDSMVSSLVVGVIGTRGIPNNYGGFERFVEQLVGHPGWADSGVAFRIYGEGAQCRFNSWTETRTVGVSKDEHPLRYYGRSTRMAVRECDVVLSCGVGISVFAVWPRLRGATLIVNPDGCEWKRTKWSRIGRVAIHAMYWPALRSANTIVLDAEALRGDFGLLGHHAAVYIPYEAPTPCAWPMDSETRDRYGIRRPFALVIARLEQENNLLMILEACSGRVSEDFEVLVVGPTTTTFYENVLSRYANDRIRFLGPIFEQGVLNQLRSNCGAYIHGHSVGGTNPSLLEALATVRGKLLSHDNSYNREVAGSEACYFASVGELRELLGRSFPCASAADSSWVRQPMRDQRYHPDTIFRAYLQLFRGVPCS